MVDKLRKLIIDKKDIFLSWPAWIVYYLILRSFFGVNNKVIYGLAVVLIVLRISFEEIALTFFVISLIIYLIGTTVEADHYLSFVFGFLFLSLLKYMYFLIKERFSSKKKYVEEF